MRSNDPQQKDVTGEFAMSMRRPSSVIPQIVPTYGGSLVQKLATSQVTKPNQVTPELFT